jgi:hypothetical protein
MPLVSVVMSVYNDGKYVRDALESILGQSFTDFEFLIVDDGCTDNTRAIIAEYNDRRIRLIINEQNLGLAPSLNKAIRLSDAKYFARQDADDISLPDRLSREVDYLESHPEVALVGSPAIVIADNGEPRGFWPVVTEDIDLKWGLLFMSSFVHSSIMARRSVVEQAGCYTEDPQKAFVEDYELWCRINRISRSANLPVPLLKFRQNPTSVSARTRDEQIRQRDRIAQENIRWLLGASELEEGSWMRLKRFLLHPPGEDPKLDGWELREALSFLESIHAAFCRKYQVPRKAAIIHRHREYWLWARHAWALALRRDGKPGLRCRLAMMGAGLRLLGNAGRLSVS